MDLRQLSAVVAVADHGSFSAAARALHTVQSNVSTHIARLERELGATLVDRSTGMLTDEGVALVNRARRIQAELDALVTDVAAVRNEVRGSVRFGVIGTTARWVLPPVLDTMAAEYPLVRVVVTDATTSSLLPQLHTGSLDLTVLAMPLDDPELEAEPLFTEDLVLIAPPDHPLADHEAVTVHDLAAHPLLLGPQGTAFRDALDRQAAAAGVELHSTVEIDGMRLLASLAFEGFGASVLPATARAGWLSGTFRAIPVEGMAGREVGIARRRRRPPSAPARAMTEVLHRIVAQEAAHQAGIHPSSPDEPTP